MSGLGTLSTLPPELGIQIYDYVLLEKNEKILVVPTIPRKLSKEAERQRILRLNRLRPCLQAGCRQELSDLCQQADLGRSMCSTLRRPQVQA